MNYESIRGQRAQTQSHVAREPIPLTQRVALSPAEFAALCGRSPTWGYRQIYAGRLKPIADCGRIIIPRAEIELVLARRREYNPTQTRGRSAPLGAAENATALQKHCK